MDGRLAYRQAYEFPKIHIADIAPKKPKYI